MTKEDIIKELDKLGNTLYEKYGTDSYLERCTVHDLKTKVKALNISVVLKPLKDKEVMSFEDWVKDRYIKLSENKYQNRMYHFIKDGYQVRNIYNTLKDHL